MHNVYVTLLYVPEGRNPSVTWLACCVVTGLAVTFAVHGTAVVSLGRDRELQAQLCPPLVKGAVNADDAHPG